MRIELNDANAEKFYLALRPEIESVPYKKTTSTISLVDSKTLLITVGGNEIGAIRGTFNSYLNWLKIIDDNLNI